MDFTSCGERLDLQVFFLTIIYFGFLSDVTVKSLSAYDSILLWRSSLFEIFFCLHSVADFI